MCISSVGVLAYRISELVILSSTIFHNYNRVRPNDLFCPLSLQKEMITDYLDVVLDLVEADSSTRNMTYYLSECLLLHARFGRYSASHLAAACLLEARILLGVGGYNYCVHLCLCCVTMAVWWLVLSGWWYVCYVCSCSLVECALF